MGDVQMRSLRLCLPVVLISLIWTGSLYAQLDNVEDLFLGGVDDVSLLVEEYLRPAGNGFGTDLNHGWYSSARAHKFLGFDITVLASAAFLIPI